MKEDSVLYPERVYNLMEAIVNAELILKQVGKLEEKGGTATVQFAEKGRPRNSLTVDKEVKGILCGFTFGAVRELTKDGYREEVRELLQTPKPSK